MYKIHHPINEWHIILEFKLKLKYWNSEILKFLILLIIYWVSLVPLYSIVEEN